MEMREPVCNPGRMWHAWAAGERCWCIGRCARWVAGRVDPLAAVIVGPEVVGMTLVQCWMSTGRM